MENPVNKVVLGFNGHRITVVGGPYTDLGSENGVLRGPFIYVKMAAEIELPYHYDVPTNDFSVPDPEVLRKALYCSMHEAMTTGKGIMVGCRGGIGRTGIFIAAMAKVTLGVGHNPIDWTRDHFKHHAVETRNQEDFIRDLKTEDIRRVLRFTTSKWRVMRWWGRFLEKPFR